MVLTMSGGDRRSFIFLLISCVLKKVNFVLINEHTLLQAVKENVMQKLTFVNCSPCLYLKYAFPKLTECEDIRPNDF